MYRPSQKRKTLFDCVKLSISGPGSVDRLEEIALPLLDEMLGANVSKLVFCLHRRAITLFEVVFHCALSGRVITSSTVFGGISACSPAEQR